MLSILLALALSAPIASQIECRELPEAQRVECVREVTHGRVYQTIERDSSGNIVEPKKRIPTQEESLRDIASTLRSMLMMNVILVASAVILAITL